MPLDKKSGRVRVGWIVFALLAGLTVVEFVISVFLSANVLLALTATAKAVIIVYYFMHVAQLRRQEGHQE